MTKFGVQEDSSQHMIYEAVLEALDDADMSMEEIDVIILSFFLQPFSPLFILPLFLPRTKLTASPIE